MKEIYIKGDIEITKFPKDEQLELFAASETGLQEPIEIAAQRESHKRIRRRTRCKKR